MEYRRIPSNSRLLKYAKQNVETFSVPVGTKITPSMNKDFERLCKALNLTPSEVIRYLIEEEIKIWKPIWESEREISATQERSYGLQSDDEEVLKVNPKITPKKKVNFQPVTKRSSGGGRFDTVQWEVNGEKPCPICSTWHSSSNLSRHLKTKHDGITAKEVFTDPKYKAVADQMVIERKDKNGL